MDERLKLFDLIVVNLERFHLDHTSINLKTWKGIHTANS